LVRYIADDDDDALTLHETAPRAYLILLSNNRISHSFPLRDQLIELGRDKGNSVVVADQKVSRWHASLAPIDDSYILSDKGSANGTYLNGVLISQPIRLKDKDRVTIGDTTFLFSREIPSSDYVEKHTIHSTGTPAPAVPVSAQPASLPSVSIKDTPLWLAIGCLGLIIIGLLFVLAVLMGLFIGRGQAAAVLPTLWQLSQLI